jgi:peptidyl-prolyl cis-trans isomerase B (cyclophilin B)
MKKTMILLLLLFTMTGCSQEEPEDNDLDETIDEITGFPYDAYLSHENPVVTIEVRDYGTIVLQLFPDVAKNTVNNFITYILDESYNGSTFHRVIEDFMIQGGIVSDAYDPIRGDFSSNGVENNLSHERGVISMARTSVNNSATSQFFIMHKDGTYLDGSYAAFGGVISGLDVLDQIASVSTNVLDAPNTTVVIESITIDLKDYVVDEVIYVEE